VWGKASSVEGPEGDAPPEKKKTRYANKKAMKTRVNEAFEVPPPPPDLKTEFEILKVRKSVLFV